MTSPITSSAILHPVRSRRLEFVLVCAFLFVLTAVLQWRSGALSVEFGSHPDEAPHYVTGVMIHDYILSGHFSPPVAFAQHFYAHYPKVAFGMWPPLFHIVEALWSLVFSTSKDSMLWLIAFLTALTGATAYSSLRQRFPWPAAMAAATLFVLLPLTQISAGAVMADMMVALLDLCAMVFLVRYFQTRRAREAVLFGISTSLCMLSKANGMALLCLPVLFMLLTRDFSVWRHKGMLYAAAIILVVGLPWQVISYDLVHRSGGLPPPTLREMLRISVIYGQVILTALGPGLAPFFLIGSIISLKQGVLNQGMDPYWAGPLALLLSVWGFHSVLGLPDARYMVPVLPAALMLAVAGFAWLTKRLPQRFSLTARTVPLGALALLLFAAKTWAIPRKPHQGFDVAAEYVVAFPKMRQVLVVSTAEGEGAFIAEMAMKEKRPGHIVLRCSKVLSNSTWFGSQYRPLFATPRELRTFLDGSDIELLVVDTRSIGGSMERKVLSELAMEVINAVELQPQNWRLSRRFPETMPDGKQWIRVYNRVGKVPGNAEVRINLPYTLGREIVHTNCSGE